MKQRSCLNAFHEQQGIKLTDVNGRRTPLQFGEVPDEYRAVRAAAGLFDVSFLGRIAVSGSSAPSLLQKTITNDVEKIRVNTAHFVLFCNESGFIAADALLFRRSADSFLLTVHAGNTDKIVSLLQSSADSSVRIIDQSTETAQFAIQGPRAPQILERLLDAPVKKFKHGQIREVSANGSTLMVSRTGYTGEHGYELFPPADAAPEFWKRIIAVGNEFGLHPCGYACRDILRIEAGFPLYGSDIDETRSPVHAGLLACVDLDKDFIGKEAISQMQQARAAEHRVGFVLLDNGTPKTGGSIFSESREIGIVTSAAMSPRLRCGIGMGYITSSHSQPGQEVEIEVRDREVDARVVAFPFPRKI
jgi:aminomethyltransferase